MFQRVAVGKAALLVPFSVAFRQPLYHLPSLRWAQCFRKADFSGLRAAFWPAKREGQFASPVKGFCNISGFLSETALILKLYKFQKLFYVICVINQKHSPH